MVEMRSRRPWSRQCRGCAALPERLRADGMLAQSAALPPIDQDRLRQEVALLLDVGRSQETDAWSAVFPADHLGMDRRAARGFLAQECCAGWG